ncbi:hypothetical protein EON67_11315 [archaeon]|nr:MAG: hypothetical protein EON67_11315 [archaeon]
MQVHPPPLGSPVPSVSCRMVGSVRPQHVLTRVPDVAPLLLVDLIQRCWKEEHCAHPTAEAAIVVLEAILEA